MSEALVNDIIDRALLCVEGEAVLRAVLDGKPWSKAIYSDTGGTWEHESRSGMWKAISTGIKIETFTGDVIAFVRPREIVARAKAITTPPAPATSDTSLSAPADSPA